MTPAELHAILGRLGLSQAGAASLLRVNVRTMRRWMDGEIPVPHAAAMVLRMYWQPIDTAPKDGTHILLWFPCIREYLVGWYDEETVDDCYGGFNGSWGGLTRSRIRSSGPSHWMPLLTPPT